MTDEQKKEYVENDGCYCPYCSSSNITTTDLLENNRQPVICYNCKSEWTDVYALVGVEEIS